LYEWGAKDMKGGVLVFNSTTKMQRVTVIIVEGSVCINAPFSQVKNIKIRNAQHFETICSDTDIYDLVFGKEEKI